MGYRERNKSILVKRMAIGTGLMVGNPMRNKDRLHRRFLVAGQAHLRCTTFVAGGQCHQSLLFEGVARCAGVVAGNAVRD
jgi:hypothetical protein